MQKTYQAAIYLRLSREDGDVTEGSKQVSNSIANQNELVMDYLKSHPEIQISDTYVDDGYSGVDFERPEFQRMLSDIRENKINCVVVKDLSRFGRNYIESGRYIEKIFPMLGIRFIAITDGYDSINEDMGSEMIIPFKNLINDAYCRDISVKIRSHMDIKRRNGEYIGAFAAYGYLKDEENKNHLVIDDYAADVVRDIFTMKLCGMSQQSIADKLNADGILSPIQYKKSIGIELESSFQKSIKPKWSYNAVLRILKNEVYTGTVVQGKCTTPNYKIKKRIHKDEAEWIRVENMHEAIVSRSEFDLVQALLLRDTRVSPDRAEVFPLAAVRMQIASAIDIIVHLGRVRDKSRKVLEIAEVAGMEDGMVQIRTLYRFCERGDGDEDRKQKKVCGEWVLENPLTHTAKLEAAGIL